MQTNAIKQLVNMYNVLKFQNTDFQVSLAPDAGLNTHVTERGPALAGLTPTAKMATWVWLGMGGLQ